MLVASNARIIWAYRAYASHLFYPLPYLYRGIGLNVADAAGSH